MTEHWFETAFGAHYPLLYRHRDQAEAERCLAQLEKMEQLGGDPTAPILDLGCGDGRHLELLLARGHRAVGLDLSADLLEFARGRSGWPEPPVLTRGDMRSLPFASGSFSAVLSLFTAFGYFGRPADNWEPVREIGEVLEPGGHWYLDYFDGDAVRNELSDGREKSRHRTLGPLEVTETRRFLAQRSVVAKDVLLAPLQGRETEAAGIGVGEEGISYTEQVAVFTVEELKSLAERGGMELVSTAGGYEGQQIGEGSRWILVFRKTSKASSI